MSEHTIQSAGRELRTAFDLATWFEESDRRIVKALDVEDEQAGTIADFLMSLRVLHHGCYATEAALEYLHGNRAEAAAMLETVGVDPYAAQKAMELGLFMVEEDIESPSEA